MTRRCTFEVVIRVLWSVQFDVTVSKFCVFSSLCKNASFKTTFLLRLISVLMTCDICYKRFTVTGDHVPQIFPCGHSYCSKCLTTLFKCRGSTSCPGCRNHYHQHNPLSLPKNYKLMEVIEEEKRKSRIRKQNQVSKVQNFLQG